VETTCESIQKYKVNYVYTSPATIIKLVNDPLAQQYDLSSVDMILSGDLCSAGILVPNMKAKILSDDDR
ncbi:hypothetical protein C2G38_2084924, partial [Gigaspora rosea]